MLHVHDISREPVAWHRNSLYFLLNRNSRTSCPGTSALKASAVVPAFSPVQTLRAA
jgi:hypothetical protein